MTGDVEESSYTASLFHYPTAPGPRARCLPAVSCTDYGWLGQVREQEAAHGRPELGLGGPRLYLGERQRRYPGSTLVIGLGDKELVRWPAWLLIRPPCSATRRCTSLNMGPVPLRHAKHGWERVHSTSCHVALAKSSDPTGTYGTY